MVIPSGIPLFLKLTEHAPASSVHVFPFRPFCWMVYFSLPSNLCLDFIFSDCHPALHFSSFHAPHYYRGIPFPWALCSVVSITHDLKVLIESFRYKQFINFQVVCCSEQCDKICVFLIHSVQVMNHLLMQSIHALYATCLSAISAVTFIGVVLDNAYLK